MIGGNIFLSTVPLYVRRKQMSAPLTPELFEEHKTRSMQVREGDTVTIMRGNFAGVEGKVTNVNYKNGRLTIDGVTREKADGTAIGVPVHPSKVVIKSLNLDDKRRKEIVERRSPVKAKAKVKKEAPKRKPRVRRKKEEKPKTEEKT